MDISGHRGSKRLRANRQLALLCIFLLGHQLSPATLHVVKRNAEFDKKCAINVLRTVMKSVESLCGIIFKAIDSCDLCHNALKTVFESNVKTEVKTEVQVVKSYALQPSDIVEKCESCKAAAKGEAEVGGGAEAEGEVSFKGEMSAEKDVSVEEEEEIVVEIEIQDGDEATTPAPITPAPATKPGVTILVPVTTPSPTTTPAMCPCSGGGVNTPAPTTPAPTSPPGVTILVPVTTPASTTPAPTTPAPTSPPGVTILVPVTTPAPITPAPTTPAPTTPAPTTPAPTTPAPTSPPGVTILVPVTTPAPTTPAPTTPAQTTPAPTTPAPVTTPAPATTPPPTGTSCPPPSHEKIEETIKVYASVTENLVTANGELKKEEVKIDVAKVINLLVDASTLAAKFDILLFKFLGIDEAAFLLTETLEFANFIYLAGTEIAYCICDNRKMIEDIAGKIDKYLKKFV